MANTGREAASLGPTVRHVVWSAVAPWTRRSGGRGDALDADPGTGYTASSGPSAADRIWRGLAANGPVVALTPGVQRPPPGRGTTWRPIAAPAGPAGCARREALSARRRESPLCRRHARQPSAGA